MPIAPTDPPEIGDLPEAPSRFTDTPDEFSQKAEDWSDALPPYSDDVDAVADWINKTADEVYSNASETNAASVVAAQSSADAQSAAQISEASANFIGVWADLTGPVSIGQSVLHNNSYWVALVAIADITASEPGVSSDWSVTGSLSLVRYSKLSNPLCHLLKKNKLVDTLSGSLSWTRASAATYIDRYGVLQNASTDEPREESKGWLTEGASTNLCLYSEQLDQSPWESGGANNVTVLSTTESAPDGTNTAYLVEDDSATVSEYLRQVFNPITSDSLTVSTYVKSGTSAIIGLRVAHTGGTNKFANLNFSTASGSWITTPPADITQNDPVECANGWWRISVTVAGGFGNTIFDYRLYPCDSNDASDTGTAIFWGAQLEDAIFSTSYIKTTSSTATRAPDVVTIDVANNTPSAGDKLSFGYYVNAFGDSQYIISADTTPSTFKYDSVVQPGGEIFSRVGSSSSVFHGNESPTAHIFYVSDGESQSAYSDGILGDSGTRTIEDDVDASGSIRIGNAFNSNSPMYGHLLDIRIYDFALNASEVAFLAGE